MTGNGGAAPDSGGAVPAGAGEPLQLPRPYSLAYERFVQEPDDLVGLIAYALFKGTVREDRVSGTQTGNARDPSALMVGHMRGSAEQKLRALIDANLELAAPDLQKSGATEAVQASQAAILARLDGVVGVVNASQAAVVERVNGTTSDVKAHVTSRTSGLIAFAIAVLAWITTLGLSVLIITLFHAGDPIKTSVVAAQNAGRKAEALVHGEPKVEQPTNETPAGR